MRPIKDQIILITGATDGLGKMVATDLAVQGATLLLHGRDSQKGEAVLREIRGISGNNQNKFYNADLRSLANVRRLAEAVKNDTDHVDVLINNAGIGARTPESKRELSEDGYELRLAINYLAPFLLTYQLVDLLKRSAPSRVVNVASVGQQKIDFDNIMLEKNYDDFHAYRQSKLALVMFTFDLAEELKGTGVNVNCLHPATLMNTKMVFDSSYFDGPISRIEQGADAVEYLAESSHLDDVTGEYFDGKEKSRANPQAYDIEARKRLKRLAEQFTGMLVSAKA